MDNLLKRNWKIELLRFVFAICVLLYHFQASNSVLIIGNDIVLGYNGRFAVEFFFVLSGYLLAKKILSKKEEVNVLDIAKSKLKSFYWILIIAIVLTLISDILHGITNLDSRYLGDIFLLYGFGIVDDRRVSVDWYLSCMMIMTIILTPILTKVKKRDKLKQDFVYLALIDGFVIIKYIFKSSGVDSYILYNLRAFSTMLLGVLIYMYNNFEPNKKKSPNIFSKAWAIMLQIAAYGYLLIYINKTTYSSVKYDTFVALICVVIIIHFAFKNSCNKSEICKFKKAWVYFCICLGRLSLPIFLFHDVIKLELNRYFPYMDSFKKLWANIAITIFLSVAVLMLKYLFDRITSRIKSVETKKFENRICLAYLIISALILALTPVADYVIETKAPFVALSNSTSYSNKSSTVRCYTDSTISEEFYVKRDSVISTISFYTITWKKEFDDSQTLKIVIKDKDTSDELYSVTKKMSEFTDARVYQLSLDKTVEVSGDTWCVIEFIPTTSEKQEYMALMMTKKSDNLGKAYINGKETDEHIAMQITCS